MARRGGIHFDPKDFARVQAILGALDPRETAGEALLQTGLVIERDAKREAPVDTGRLRSSITTEQEGWNRVVVGTNVEYAEAVEFGTPPHVIEPKEKKALAFTVGGKRVVVKRVNHPGTKARPFLRRAFRKHFPATFAKLWVRTVKKRIEQVK